MVQATSYLFSHARVNKIISATWINKNYDRFSFTAPIQSYDLWRRISREGMHQYFECFLLQLGTIKCIIHWYVCISISQKQHWTFTTMTRYKLLITVVTLAFVPMCFHLAGVSSLIGMEADLIRHWRCSFRRRKMATISGLWWRSISNIFSFYKCANPIAAGKVVSRNIWTTLHILVFSCPMKQLIRTASFVMPARLDNHSNWI